MLSKLWLRDVGSMLPCQSSCAAHACAPHWVMIRASRVRGQALRMTAAGAALGRALGRHSLAVHTLFCTPSLWGCTAHEAHSCLSTLHAAAFPPSLILPFKPARPRPRRPSRRAPWRVMAISSRAAFELAAVLVGPTHRQTARGVSSG